MRRYLCPVIFAPLSLRRYLCAALSDAIPITCRAGPGELIGHATNTTNNTTTNTTTTNNTTKTGTVWAFRPISIRHPSNGDTVYLLPGSVYISCTQRCLKSKKERRARDSNPQPVARHFISNEAASHSLTLRTQDPPHCRLNAFLSPMILKTDVRENRMSGDRALTVRSQWPSMASFASQLAFE